MRYGEQQLALKLGMCAGWLEAGRTVAIAKQLAGVTLAAMKKYGLIYENMIPDPQGYTFDAEGKPSGHNGHMLHTGVWIPTCGDRRPAPSAMSNKAMKRKDRKRFFDFRRGKIASF